MKVFTRPQGPGDTGWDVVIWTSTGTVKIATFNQRHAVVFADLLVTLIRAFGPCEVSRCE